MAKGKKILHGRLLCGAAAIALMAGSSAHAQDARFNIAPQPLDTALREFGVQSGVTIMADAHDTLAKQSPGFSATADPETALKQLLAGTGLTYRRNGDVFVVASASDPQSGSAAGDGADNGTVQALIVTAQKREEDIQDVPIAISAFTQEDLTRSQVAGGPDLITQVPNMTFTKTNFSSYSIQLRGIGTQAISATTDPAVAVAFNNTPFIRNRFFEQEFYDLQRVEVLRGPQGTLYGRNATAGVVNLISQKPKFTYEAKLSGDLGNYSSHRLEGMVNIPLVKDAVALRIAGAWTKRDGYATNELTDSPIDGRDLWSTRVSLRISPNDRVNANLIWEHFQEDDDRLRSGKQLCKKDVVTHVGDIPITHYYDTRVSGGLPQIFAGVQAALSQGCTRNSLYAMDSFQRPTGLMLPYYAPLVGIGLPAALNDPYVGAVFSDDPAVVSATNDQPQDLRVIQSTVDPDYRAKADLGELQVSFDLTDSLTLTSETAYSVDQVWSLEDFNRFDTAPGAWQQPEAANIERDNVLLEGPNGGIFCDPQLGCSDRLVAVDISTAKARQFSQELRLASDFDGPFNFSLGANFLRADSEDKYYVFFNSISLIAAYPLFVEMPPYVPNQSDNAECLKNGYLPGDPQAVYGVQACTYIDPNPIGSLNDKGHNYFLSKNPYKLISYAVFGEAYYQLADNLKLTAGLRWTVDKKEAPRIPSWTFASQSYGYPVADVSEQEWREPTGRLTLDWKPDLSFTDETLLYGSYAHGYKAGGANPPGFVREYYADDIVALAAAEKSETRPRTFDPEFVDAFELGSKNTVADGRATLNLAAFYYDYTGYQVSEIVDRSAYNRNFDATVWGLELEADWRPLENLRLGFKTGYEKTRIKDGEEAIDLMDRTAGNPDWLVARPFPTYTSNCIVPTYVFENPDGSLGRTGGVGGGGPSVCELAYLQGLDPVTDAPYVDLLHGGVPAPTYDQIFNNLSYHPGYPGWDPTIDYGNNNGEGFAKQLGGNELPNAPALTATITADYTFPLGNEWLATLHTDLHWQSESWWRVFNDDEFDKLDEYFTMNLAAIFTNEEAGWNVMAYIKNVTDKTAITGAFLNSDDTGLTTNVFLTEPRLYGLRVTKNFTGGSLLGTFGERHDGPYPFTLELGGQAQRTDASNIVMMPSYANAFAAPLDIFDDVQNADLDWGDAREVKLTWRPSGGVWALSAELRRGNTNGVAEGQAQYSLAPVCLIGGDLQSLCDVPLFDRVIHYSAIDNADATAVDGESYQVAGLAIHRDVPFGGLSQSSFGLGLRQVKLESATSADFRGIPDWVITPNSFPDLISPGGPVKHTLYNIDLMAERQFEGFGPTVSWDAAYTLIPLDAGRIDLAWSADGGVAFGQRKTSITGSQLARTFEFATAAPIIAPGGYMPLTGTTVGPPIAIERSEDVTVPTFAASLGLAYKIDRFSIDAGYRWERYFNAIDGGYDTAKDADRTIDGPYFKVAVGFGG